MVCNLKFVNFISQKKFIICSQLENVRMLDKYNTKTPSKGTLYLTATHLIFVDHDLKKETWVFYILNYHTHIQFASVENKM